MWRKRCLRPSKPNSVIRPRAELWIIRIQATTRTPWRAPRRPSAASACRPSAACSSAKAARGCPCSSEPPTQVQSAVVASICADRRWTLAHDLADRVSGSRAAPRDLVHVGRVRCSSGGTTMPAWRSEGAGRCVRARRRTGRRDRPPLADAARTVTIADVDEHGRGARRGDRTATRAPNVRDRRRCWRRIERPDDGLAHRGRLRRDRPRQRSRLARSPPARSPRARNRHQPRRHLQRAAARGDGDARNDRRRGRTRRRRLHGLIARLRARSARSPTRRRKVAWPG